MEEKPVGEKIKEIIDECVGDRVEKEGQFKFAALYPKVHRS